MDRHVAGGTKGKGWRAASGNKPQAAAEESKGADLSHSEVATQRLVGRRSIRGGVIHRGAVGRKINKPHTIPKQHEIISAADRVAIHLQGKPLSCSELYGLNRTDEATSDKN
jgi:hypothetical protein